VLPWHLSREVEEIQEMQSHIDAANALLEAEQKARLASEASHKAEIKKCMDMCMKCMSDMENDKSEVETLRQLLNDETQEHAESRKQMVKLQADMMKIVEKMNAKNIAPIEPKKEAQQMTMEVQRDQLGRANRLVMVKG